MGKEVLVKDVMSTPLISIRDDQTVQKAFKKMKGYVFSWDEIPGNDQGDLIEFLKQKFSIDWVKEAKIEKIDDGRTIKVSTGKNSLLLRLNDEKTEVKLKIDDGRTTELIAKKENGKLNIYMKGVDLKKITIVNTKGDLIGITDAWKLKLVDSNMRIDEVPNDKKSQIITTVSTVSMNKPIEAVAPMLQEEDFLVVTDDRDEKIGAISRIDLRKLDALIWPFVLKTTSFFKEKYQEKYRKIVKDKTGVEPEKVYNIQAIIVSDVPGVLERIDHVEYLLPSHPGDRYRQVKYYKDKFLLKDLAYGPVPIYAKVYLKGRDSPIELQEYITLKESGPRLL